MKEIKEKNTEIIEINDKVYGPEITIEYQDEEEREQIISILNSYRDVVPYDTGIIKENF